MMKRISLFLLVAALLAACVPFSATAATEAPDYSDPASWVYQETDVTDKRADVFFVTTTASTGRDGLLTIDLKDESRIEKFVGNTNKERGLYDADCRVFAPFYRQAALPAFFEPGAENNEYFSLAYEDVRAAFLYYLDHFNQGRPIVLAGFSQGAIMCMKLMKEFFGDEDLNSRLIACYAIGWRVWEDELQEYPHLRFAQGEDDTGVIIAFTGEAESVSDSSLVREGTKTLSINPLNWKTDSTPADKSLNLGACFTDYSGDIVTEIPNLTGCYIDETRGTLKVTDVTAEEYPGQTFEDGVFHVYDYSFFYRNLQKNVQTRIDAYFEKEN